MNCKMKQVFFIFFVCFYTSMLSSCMTSMGSYFTERQQVENKRQFLLQQQEREEELVRERFRISVDQALSTVAAQLTIDLYKKLGKGDMANNDFQIRNINYYYQKSEAYCPITISWVRRKKQIVITGNLIYQNNGYVRFVCTDASNIRFIDEGYIRKITRDGLYYKI